MDNLKDLSFCNKCHDFTIKNPEIEALKAENKKLQQLITDIYGSCLCTRAKTKGFDHHENHPKLGKPNGGRWLTPCDLIENRIGFEWKYEKPEGCCNSWKELTFNKVD